MSSAIALAVVCSFAFKSAKQSNVNASYHPVYLPWTCANGFQVGDNCAIDHTGAQCTIIDWNSNTYVPAYLDNGPQDVCVRPLYDWF
ncbi:hypothetical protein ACFS5N_05930 [Mucilaginibacter ximonensis]|uniref:Secreted protein n=1 Tax=Mucilaginibacter ximonensis TaxID=538021 RepID=A0ABW5Y9N6_9SPHI